MSGSSPAASLATAEPPEFLRRHADIVERVLAELAATLPPTGTSRLSDAIRYALQTRGKRLRPALVAVAYEAVIGRAATAGVYDLGCAVELIHTYSLVHDDLPCMDDDDLRRGRATVHRAFDNATATVAGAALIPLAVGIAGRGSEKLGLPAAAAAAAIGGLCRAAGAEGMVAGQWLDLQAENQPASTAALEAIHRRKTGALLAESLRLGGRAASANPEQLAALHQFGISLGLAFQITDDVLDETARTAELGKTAGRDAALGKSTYPAHFGIEGARALARQHIERGGEHLRASAPIPRRAARGGRKVRARPPAIGVPGPTRRPAAGTVCKLRAIV